MSRYTKINFFSYLIACFTTIALIVFLSSTQSFFLTDVLGKSVNIGGYIGSLGFYSEIVTLICSPVFGAASDVWGTKYVSSFGVFMMGITLLLMTYSHSVYPGLLMYRLMFAIGATASTSMISAMLTELTASDFKILSVLQVFNKKHTIHIEDANENTPIRALEHQEFVVPVPTSRSGKLSAMIGVATGCGAIFAVSVFLPLPIKFGKNHSADVALIYSYYLVGGIAIAISLILSVGLYHRSHDTNSQNFSERDTEESNEEHDLGYLSLIKKGFEESSDHQVLLSYFASLVARSATIVTSLFIPFFIYNYYFKIGQCKHNADKVNCYDGYKYAAILTGVAQTVGLCVAPTWGIASDKYGKKITLAISAAIGAVSSLSMSSVSDPHTPRCIFSVIGIGVSEIGLIIISMSLISEKRRSHSGSISGVYSLFGAVGILFITKVGGTFADLWVGAPFLILGLFNIILVFLCRAL